MQKEDIQIIDDTARETLWLCNVILEYPIRPDIFRRFSKDDSYQDFILMIFQLVRSWLLDLPQERCQCYPSWYQSSKTQRILVCHGTEDPQIPLQSVQAEQMVASADRRNNIVIHLWRRFWKGNYGRSLTRILAQISNHASVMEEVDKARSATLLRELVHVVSW